jgi:hypothetical protein
MKDNESRWMNEGLRLKKNKVQSGTEKSRHKIKISTKKLIICSVLDSNI